MTPWRSPPLLAARAVEVRIDPQPRTTVGSLEIRGNQDIADRTITNALQLREGNVLRTNDIVASQRSLYESNLFHEARVSVPEQPDSVKLLVIEVREAPQRAGRIGGGFNTIEFFQAEARFTHYNWMGGGRRFDMRGAVGNLLAPQFNDRGIFRDVLPAGLEAGDASPFLQPTWQASADLMQPAFRAAANTLGFSVFTNRRLIPAIVIDRGYGAELSLTRRLDYRVPATLSYRFEQTTVEAGDLYFCVNYGICDLPTVQALRGRHRLSPANVGFFADRANHPLAPTRGFRARLDVEHASGLTASDFHYNRIAGEATRYIPFGVQQRRVLAGRVRAGWVQPLASTGEAVGVGSEEQSLLHPRKRFYAGGSRSVRGFRENQLGPRILTVDPAALRGAPAPNGATAWICEPERDIRTCDPNAEGIASDAFIPRPVGGTSVIEASVEYRFPFWGPLQGAVFVDGARVGTQGNGLEVEGRTYVTPGVGARFATPVGPIRVDLGIRPTVAERLPVVTEIVDPDGERRLVRLDLPRDHDPTSVRGGFLGQALARLTLHLSIGEAF